MSFTSVQERIAKLPKLPAIKKVREGINIKQTKKPARGMKVTTGQLG